VKSRVLSVEDRLRKMRSREGGLMAEVKADLLGVEYRDAFRAGARNAVRTCLRILPSEKVTLITDEATSEIAASIAAELKTLGCTWNGFVLEELAPRPLSGMPAEVLADMETSDVSIFAVQVQPNELRSRMDMTDVVNRRHMRHAHMVNITPDVMLEGMCADFNAVDRLSQKVLDKVRAASYVRATNAAGTLIRAEMELQVVQDLRDHQPREVGEPAGRRVLHGAGGGERSICGGWRGGGFSVCALRDFARDAADDPD
jgi:hypothetical protein